MNSTEIKDLMRQFDQSSLREFSYTNGGEQLYLSKNQQASLPAQPSPVAVELSPSPVTALAPVAAPSPDQVVGPVAGEESTPLAVSQAEGELVTSPLVGVAYLAPGPDKPAFVTVGDQVKKGQTLLIIEAMKVMNEVPADRDGVVTEIVVNNQDVVEFGQGLVRIK